jgi:hypothetical protein
MVSSSTLGDKAISMFLGCCLLVWGNKLYISAQFWVKILAWAMCERQLQSLLLWSTKLYSFLFRKILFSHLFWLDSHLFCRSDFVTPWFREPCSAWLLLMHSNLFCLKSDRQKRCESSQKRCENRIFLFLSNSLWIQITQPCYTIPSTLIIWF